MPDGKVLVVMKKDNVIDFFNGTHSPDMSHVVVDTGRKQTMAWAVNAPADIMRSGKRVYWVWAEVPYTLHWYSFMEWQKLESQLNPRGNNGSKDDGGEEGVEGSEKKKRGGNMPIGYFQMTKDRRVVDLIADRKVMPNIFGQVRILSKTELFGLIAIGALFYIMIRVVVKAMFPGVILP